MPTALADGGVLGDHAAAGRGVLDRHLPAAEVGQLGAQVDVAVVQRRTAQLSHGATVPSRPPPPGVCHGRAPHSARLVTPTAAGLPSPRVARMTSVSLIDRRNAVTADAIVVATARRHGGCAGRRRGRGRRRPGRRAAPALRRSRRPAGPTRWSRSPRSAGSTPRWWWPPASARRSRDPAAEAVRRAVGRRAAVLDAAEPGGGRRRRRHRPGLVGAITDGALLGGYRFTRYKSRARRQRAAPGRHRGDRPDRPAARAAVRRAGGDRRGGRTTPATWSTRRPTTSTR